MSARRLVPVADEPAARGWVFAGAFMLALVFATAPVVLFDDRRLDGAWVWTKPLKFQLSLAIHYFTLAALAGLLSDAPRRGLSLRFWAAASIAAGLFEVVWIMVQAARGRASHFNFETGFEGLMYAAMGLGALVLVLAPLVMGLLLAGDRNGDQSGLKRGAILGLIVAAPLTIGVAGFMSATGSHYFGGGTSPAAEALPLFGWSTALPDLRPAHFLALHLIQIGPAAGWLGDRISPAAGRLLATIAVSFGALLSGLAFAIALSGASPVGWLGPQ